MSDTIQIKTVGFDARFPNTNQTRNCWQNYVDYFSCVAAGGSQCTKYEKAYKSLCPGPWTDQWDDLREAGYFPALREDYPLRPYFQKYD